MIRLLTFSTLYPSAVSPSHGIFVETRLRHLLASGKVEARVIAPVPWFPVKHPRFGEYAGFASVPLVEERHGIQIAHPRFIRLPKIGMTTAPFTLAKTAIASARQLIASGYDFDLIDAHYFYPDGVAAVMMGKALGKPVVITARGTDVNLIPTHALPRRMILDAAAKSSAVITVCSALKEELVALGANGNKITVLRNGVDLKLFQPTDRNAARDSFGMSRFALLSVGHLIPRKGHELVIQALAQIPDAELHIAGNGPQEGRLRAFASSTGVADRVTFLGAVSQDKLRAAYAGADCLVLASSREGWANVLLEAMACGTPVVASNVWGTPEVVAVPQAGVLMRNRSASGIVEAVASLRANLPDRTATRSYAEQFSWDDTTVGQLKIFESILASGSRKDAGK